MTISIFRRNAAHGPEAMQALFVHGMGRSPLSGWPMLRRLRKADISTETFGYMTSSEGFSPIRDRLAGRIAQMASRGDYILIGHSLGGVLIRAALADLPETSRQPGRVFLLGSPVRASRLAHALRDNLLYRMGTGECGQMLASAQAMQEIAPPITPTTGIFGSRGTASKHGPFDGEINDGVVALSEISADWMEEAVQLPLIHTLLPSSRLVAEAILQRIAAA